MGNITNDFGLYKGYNDNYFGSFSSIERKFKIDFRAGVRVNYVGGRHNSENFVFNSKFNKVIIYNNEEITGYRWLMAYFEKELFIIRDKGDIIKFDVCSREITPINDFIMMGYNLNGNSVPIVTANSTIGLYDFQEQKIIWENNNMDTKYLAANENYIINTNSSYSQKTCLDIRTGEHIWTIRGGEYKPLGNCEKLGRNILIDNTIIGHGVVSPSNGYRQREDVLWFAIDIKTKELIWKMELPFHRVSTIYCDKCYHYIYLNEDNERFYYSKVDFTTGITTVDIDITDQMIKAKKEDDEIFGPDPYLRAMTISEKSVYFGIGRRYVQMNRSTYEIEVLYEGKSVFDNSEFAFGRLFVTEMIGGTVMFSEKDAPETDLDRFFAEQEDEYV